MIDAGLFEGLFGVIQYPVEGGLTPFLRRRRSRMSEAKPADSPNEHLAGIVAQALVREGLIPSARLDEVRQQLANGRMREADWRVLIEMAVPGMNKVGGHG
jgi:hypothetical protein